MVNGKEKQKKAAKRIRKAVRKAVAKGLTERDISQVVDATLSEPAKPKKSGHPKKAARNAKSSRK